MQKTEELQRLKVVIRGAVQGVGFRPFIYRLAEQLHLKGWVRNTTEGILIEAEGPVQNLKQFLVQIQQEKPSISFIQSFEPSFLDPIGYSTFEIRESTGGEPQA